MGRGDPHACLGPTFTPHRGGKEGSPCLGLAGADRTVTRAPAGTSHVCGREAAGPRCSLSGAQGCLPAWASRDTPRNSYSELQRKCAGWNSMQVPGPLGQLLRIWTHLTPFHSGETAGGAQAAGLLDLRAASEDGHLDAI
ncbi:hypothetical protein NDU88_003047 [Pleurodeles waltl]|uniref:Uncharacterized protein n=1 Tax=Pleurodeles waltl TaxID=8319 RepID=A0AAV7SDQ5_PLEWA|nr:hypothetical protein NDU88_003047 [Pleurodeles waltl]